MVHERKHTAILGSTFRSVVTLGVYLARERARGGDRDDAIAAMRSAAEHLFRTGRLLLWGVPATGVLVETLLDRRADGDLAEAEAAIERLAEARADEGLVVREIWLLKLQALRRGPAVPMPAIAITGIAIATGRNRLASRGILRGQRNALTPGPRA